MINLYDFAVKRLTLASISRHKRYNAGIENHALFGMVDESEMNGVDV